ncbi:MarR family transcriptional regulator [Paenarthrobacter sp. Z7-10]|uniref:MarR family winged helix-turn-helix transcriptional regulator n=1 Tax=Paenarthrobacter sp. Z7-10 TaxID=2787635 RepID=UPI0022A9EC80|nr:MarR family transcriptional regulator [Paenarthrobacter sp. Z7-10]MCZ2405016.1 MarR family transcriptional regulator [Paenarthrobacter sp. Z7-10]
MEYLGNQILAPLNLTMSSFTALISLNAAGPLSQAALAGSLRIRAQTVGKILQGLENEGFITRNKGVFDRRSTKVALTDAGREALQDAQKAVNDLSLENADASAELRLLLKELIRDIPATDTNPRAHPAQGSQQWTQADGPRQAAARPSIAEEGLPVQQGVPADIKAIPAVPPQPYSG